VPTDHYNLLVRDDRAIDRAMLFRIAHRKARAERADFIALGSDRPYARCLAEALRQVWERVNGLREAIRPAVSPSPLIDRTTALRRELELLPYREDYRAAQMRRRDIEAELGRH